jgi:hypothetical protein
MILDQAGSGAKSARLPIVTMSDTPPDPRARFEHFGNEYAQALQALEAIEHQASTLMLLGSSDELRLFIEQFLDMATRVRAEAAEEGVPHFAEWFTELIEKAEALRAAVPSR